jgi:hypothetical protein
VAIRGAQNERIEQKDQKIGKDEEGAEARRVVIPVGFAIPVASPGLPIGPA